MAPTFKSVFEVYTLRPNTLSLINMLETTFLVFQVGGWVSGWMGDWVAGLNENITNSAPNWVELGLGAELGILVIFDLIHLISFAY